MSPQDRRAAPRHQPACDRVRVAWTEDKALHHAEARLGDLSSGGAAIVVEGPRPARGPVWIGLEGTPLSEWMIADLVGVVPLDGTRWRAGIRFVRPCGPRFFRRAIWGLTPEGDMAARVNRPDRTRPCSCAVHEHKT
jgi:hypothetical protein